jgi:CheY-like chemotaxis protein
VIVYDIALPYDANWRLCQHIRSAPACQGVPFVLTTTNVAQVRAVSGAEEPILEIIGKPYDLGMLVDAVAAAAKKRSR